MSTDTNLDKETSVLEALDFALPCESPGHATGQHLGGAAEWRVTLKCPACIDAADALVCGGFRDWVLKKLADNGTTFCPACNFVGPTLSWNYVFTPMYGND